MVISLISLLQNLAKKAAINLLENRSLNREQMLDMLGQWLQDYPIASIEDPLAEDDVIGSRLYRAFW